MSDWGSVTTEEFIGGEHEPTWSYMASKVLAEQAAWEFAAREPALDLATSVFRAQFQIPPYISN